MIDIHNHMLPTVDDGAKTNDMALSMLKEATRQGVEQLVLTPHLYEADIIKSTAYWKSKIELATRVVQDLIAVHQLSIKVTVAAEVRYQDMLPIILEELDVLIGGKYLLLEFSFNFVPNNLERIIFEITNQGITPIIAHPERIKPWQHDPLRLEELINMGCPMQVDIGSFLGTLGPNSEKLANFLLERDAIHIAGSDSHNITSRPLYTKPGHTWLAERYGKEYADMLLITNPTRIVNGDPVAVYPVDLSPSLTSWKSKILNVFKSS